MKHHLVLLLHLLAATIWVGGHLILLLRYVPKAIRTKKLDEISFFRKNFEPVGIPSLIVLLITGIIMSYDFGVSIDQWFSFQNPIEKVISIKLLLLIFSIMMAISAVKFIFPKLRDKPTTLLYLLITVVTLIAVTMVVLGSLFRIGGL